MYTIRYMISPSPATGLLGMEENSLLRDFFQCLGFLKITSER